MSTELGIIGLTKIVVAALDSSAIEDICKALESNRLTKDSTGPVRHGVSKGNPIVEQRINDLQDVWRTYFASTSGRDLALAIRAAAASMSVAQKQVAATELVWTGPKVDGSYLRSTRQVVKDIVLGAKSDLLVVGYWISGRSDDENIIHLLIKQIADAVTRGVKVKMALDDGVRENGPPNIEVLRNLWPENIKFPEVFTWDNPNETGHVKLHAKVLVADKSDALVTSANLTHHALDLNMEMGVRIMGPSAKQITDHYNLLIGRNILIPYGLSSSRGGHRG